MKVAKLLEIGCKYLKMMSENDVMRDDWRFLPMYDEYKDMRHKGDKYRYVIAYLSEKYQVSESTVSRKMKQLSCEVKE